MQRQPSSSNLIQSASSGRRQQNSDVKKTFILFSIVVVFALCHSLRIILNLDEFFNLSRFKEERKKGCHGVKFWAQVVVPLNQLMIIINSSANFFIYVFFDKGFQLVLRHACVIRSEPHGHTINIANSETNMRDQTAVTRINNTNDIELSNMNSNRN